MAPQRVSTLWRTQNFLRRTTSIERLIARSGLNPSDVVYDIGAGTGVLTALLARRVGRVIAIEKDEALVRQLRFRFADRPNVTVRYADFMEYRLPRAPYKVVANPPFDITAAVVTKLTSAAMPPDDVFLALQTEAADRYCGRPRETLASLLLAPFFEATIVHRFRRQDFVPIPGVDVVMLRLRKRGPPLVGRQHRQLYRDFVVAGFTAWRPSIGRAFARRLGSRVTHRLLAAVELDPDRRPSDVPFAMWLRLFETFSHLPPAMLGRVAGAEDRLSRQQRRLEKRHRTRVPRDDLIARLRRQPHEMADAFDDTLTREYAGERSRPWVVGRTHELADRHLAAVR
jgi:23S rRNA (adenine-N6)-dimethyltransferase